MIIYACMHAVAWAQSRGIYSDLCCTISNYVQGGQAYMHAQHHARSKIYHACTHAFFVFDQDPKDGEKALPSSGSTDRDAGALAILYMMHPYKYIYMRLGPRLAICSSKF